MTLRNGLSVSMKRYVRDCGMAFPGQVKTGNATVREMKKAWKRVFEAVRHSLSQISFVKIFYHLTCIIMQ